jgi:hypothetical protein
MPSKLAKPAYGVQRIINLSAYSGTIILPFEKMFRLLPKLPNPLQLQEQNVAFTIQDMEEPINFDTYRYYIIVENDWHKSILNDNYISICIVCVNTYQKLPQE